MKQRIKDIVSRTVRDSGLPYYREPLLGAAPARAPYFLELKKLVNPGHFLPGDLLTDAVSVIAFFLPFQRTVVDGNRERGLASREWAEA